MSVLIYLTSGLFLGWSLGANDAANIFGAAVGSKMVKFRTAAIVLSIFVILGAAVSGAGATGTIGRLGSVNEIAGSFIVTLSAGITVYWMTYLNLPVSTSQSIVGAIIGWNMFSGSLTDYNSLTKILLSWIMSPVLAAFFSIVLYLLANMAIKNIKIHLMKIDFYNRIAFIIIGAFGSYALGANNIANVMGVFVPVSPLSRLDLQFASFSSAEQLFTLGGIAIAVGVFTYSERIMKTVGSDIIKLNPIAALIVVLSSSIVLFLFASPWLENRLDYFGLPVIPLVPVSSSQVIVGAVIGIGLIKGGRGLNFSILRKIGSGWVVTPIIACLISFISLFFLQNVFKQKVYYPVNYLISQDVILKLKNEKNNSNILKSLKGIKYKNAVTFKKSLLDIIGSLKIKINDEKVEKIIQYSRLNKIKIDIGKINFISERSLLSVHQAVSLFLINGKIYNYSWQMSDDLVKISPEWQSRTLNIQNKKYNKKLRSMLAYLEKIMKIE